MRKLYSWIALGVAVAAPAIAGAQHPARPVHLVSPVGAGSGADTLARILARGLAKALGQPVLVENKPGADGAIAARAVATAVPDGHTLLFGGSATFALPLTISPPPFASGDLVAASTVGQITYGLFVHPSVAGRSWGDFVSHARRHPGRINYGSVNLATEVGAQYLMKAAGIRMTKVPYKGGGQVMADLVAGRVHVFFGPVANGLPFVKDGRLLHIASHPHRSSLAPEVPTLGDEGVHLEFRPLHYMVLVPGRTPPEVLERVGRAVNAALDDAEVRAQLESQGLKVGGATPQQAAMLVEDGISTWRAFLREVGPRD